MAPTYFGDGDTMVIQDMQIEFKTGGYITHSNQDNDFQDMFIKNRDYCFVWNKDRAPFEVWLILNWAHATGAKLKTQLMSDLQTNSIPFVEDVYTQAYKAFFSTHCLSSEFGGYSSPGAESWVCMNVPYLNYVDNFVAYYPEWVDRSQISQIGAILPIAETGMLYCYNYYYKKKSKLATRSENLIDNLTKQARAVQSRALRFDVPWGAGGQVAITPYGTQDYPVYVVTTDKITPYVPPGPQMPPKNPVQETLVEITDVDIFEVQKAGAMVHIDASDYSLDSTPLYFGFTLPAQIFYKKNIYDWIEAIGLPTGGYKLPDLRDRGVFVKQNDQGIRWLTYHADGNCVQYGCPRCTNLYVRI